VWGGGGGGPPPAPPVCQKTGKPPALNGDPFSPVECSTSPKAALPLPEEPAAQPAAPDFKAFKGRWEGLLIRGFGRYACALEVKPGWGGKAELTLSWKEQQTRMAGSTTLALAPSKGGGYAVTVTASALPGASLAGLGRFSRETDAAGLDGMRLDLSFPNGATHRVRWSLSGKDALRFRAAWAVPEAPVQALDGELKRLR
jgi:hypothetical protein